MWIMNTSKYKDGICLSHNYPTNLRVSLLSSRYNSHYNRAICFPDGISRLKIILKKVRRWKKGPKWNCLSTFSIIISLWARMRQQLLSFTNREVRPDSFLTFSSLFFSFHRPGSNACHLWNIESFSMTFCSVAMLLACNMWLKDWAIFSYWSV